MRNLAFDTYTSRRSEPMQSPELLIITLILLSGILMMLSGMRYLILDFLFYRRHNWDLSQVPPWGRRRTRVDGMPLRPAKGKERFKMWAGTFWVGSFFTFFPFTLLDFSTYWQSLKSAFLSLL